MSIRVAGDITSGAASTGGMWERGDLGTVEVGEDGTGGSLVDVEMEVWEVIGRSMVVCREKAEVGRAVENAGDTLVGVVARSAGVWENTKVVSTWENEEGGGALIWTGLLVLGEEYLGGEDAECWQGHQLRWGVDGVRKSCLVSSFCSFISQAVTRNPLFLPLSNCACRSFGESLLCTNVHPLAVVRQIRYSSRRDSHLRVGCAISSERCRAVARVKRG